MHILLGQHIISSSDLHAAERMLTVIYETTTDLYPEELCTMNVHSLIHLPQTVRNFGPLWAYSCFGFESMNGHLKKHCHGTCNVLPQLVHNLRFHQTAMDADYNAEDHKDSVRGRVKQKTLSQEYLQALNEGNFDTSNPLFPVFDRYKLNGILYIRWKNSDQLRNSSVCKFLSANGTQLFGSIQSFCLSATVSVAIIAAFHPAKDAFEGMQRATVPDLNISSLTKSCVFKVEKTQQLQAVAVS